MKTPHARRALPAALLAGLVVIVGACSTGATDDHDPGPDGASVAASDAADPESTASEEEDWRSPLGEFLQQSREQVQVDQAQIEHDNRAFAEAVQECMAAQGFDFHHDAADQSGTRDGRGPFSLPEDEFAAAYGYGITTIDEDGRRGWQDPNAAMLDEMSVAERTAWHRARYGDSMQIDENGDLVGMPAPVSKSDDIDRGCEGQAADEVWGSDGIDHEAVEERFASLFSDMMVIWERVDQDPRVAAAVEDWSACMADTGHPGMADTHDAYSAVRERMLDVTGTEDLAATTDGSGRDVARAAAAEALATTDPAQVQALREFEVAMAVADLECQRSARVDEVRQQVQTDVEIAFIEEHRDELEAYRAAVGDAETQG